MRSKSLLFASFTLCLSANAASSTSYFPNELHDGPISAQFVSTGENIDRPRISPGVNASTFDWWYFDVASTSSANETITVVFFERGPTGFLGNVTTENTLSVQVTGTMKNGTVYNIQSDASANASAVINTSNNSIYGDWETTGFRFAGTEGGTKYTISINDAKHEIFGSITFESTAPGHLPCGTNSSAGETELITPHVGWANILPGAHAAVSLTLRGEEIQYNGVGYHDKNWGDVPFASIVQNWYWGHAIVGPYTLVWFDAMLRDGHEYTSGYVSKNGVLQLASCAEGRHSVRPWGENSAYPPTNTTGRAQGLEVYYKLDDGDILTANVTTGAPQIEFSNYARYIASVEGSLLGSQNRSYSGVGIWELFRF
ncbi:hypothetical protein COCVIDRAFT_112274 [Bipolaris victoriae FI3]|uniref:AttH domain-containing protein n=1 Tax=Bipolaris victoriae (strain FI3) TaxID=930091 RepID=W7E849_BIPV3|nr:hypothetical protein COCVIDRAFT_112274 [Bipolaris victoriae FI3]